VRRPTSSPSASPPGRPPRHSPAGAPRRWHLPAEDDTGWWSITFSDLVLLLFCFFVLWHVADKRRVVAAARAIRHVPVQPGEAIAPAGGPLLSAPEPAAETVPPADTGWQSRTGSTEISPLTTRNPPRPESSTGHAIRSPSEPAPPALQPEPPAPPPEPHPATVGAEADSGWQEMQAEISRYLHAHDLARTVGVVSTEHGLVIALNEAITFPSGRATLNPAAAPVLARVAALAAERPDLGVEISGHTDDQPIATAEFPSNWELSAARASRVARALLEQGGIDPTRVSTRGYAHYRPLTANDSDAQRAANRRVEIRFFRQVS